MPASPDVSRRSFLRSGAAVAALALPAVQARGAGETINVGLIGTGGRCRHLMKALARIPKVRMTAVCDVYDKHLAEGRKLADPKALATKKYKEVLDRKDINAVLIATPDHWHVPLTVEAIAAGKDVYVEKPLTHSLEEGKTILAALKKHERIVQVGTQQRSMPQFIKGRELIRDKRLGKVCKVRLSWNRNSDRVRKHKLGVNARAVDWKAFLGSARKQDFDEYRFLNWRWFWDFGGGIFTDLMVHFIDVAHWYLGLDHPLTARSIGAHFTSKGVWETPDTVQTLLTYPGDVQVHFEGTFSNARHGAHIEFMGTEATLYLDRGRYELHPEPRRKGKAEVKVLGKGPLGADFYKTPDGEYLHLENWMACIRDRKKTPSAPVQAGVSAAAAAHLANQALRTGKIATWKE
jgi:predicted dehydrogenase